MKILEIGSGLNYYKPKRGEAVIHLDRVKLLHIEVIWDLEKIPLPFKNNEFDKILAIHVLEHIRNFIPLMEELYRILKLGGLLEVVMPYYKYKDSFRDPTHVRFVTENTMDYFDPRTELGYKYGFYSKAKFSVLAIRENRSSLINSSGKYIKNIWLRKMASFLTAPLGFLQTTCVRYIMRKI